MPTYYSEAAFDRAVELMKGVPQTEKNTVITYEARDWGNDAYVRGNGISISNTGQGVLALSIDQQYTSVGVYFTVPDPSVRANDQRQHPLPRADRRQGTRQLRHRNLRPRQHRLPGQSASRRGWPTRRPRHGDGSDRLRLLRRYVHDREPAVLKFRRKVRAPKTRPFMSGGPVAS